MTFITKYFNNKSKPYYQLLMYHKIQVKLHSFHGIILVGVFRKFIMREKI